MRILKFKEKDQNGDDVEAQPVRYEQGHCKQQNRRDYDLGVELGDIHNVVVRASRVGLRLL